jgi:hypothetical protein
MNIAVETTRALKHLYASNVIKTRNIFLDADFHAKVGDYRLSHDLLTDQSHIRTGAQGTPVYLDHSEYDQYNQLTHKSDSSNRVEAIRFSGKRRFWRE